MERTDDSGDGHGSDNEVRAIVVGNSFERYRDEKSEPWLQIANSRETNWSASFSAGGISLKSRETFAREIFLAFNDTVFHEIM
jgi:hypothetical protein